MCVCVCVCAHWQLRQTAWLRRWPHNLIRPTHTASHCCHWLGAKSAFSNPSYLRTRDVTSVCSVCSVCAVSAVPTGLFCFLSVGPYAHYVNTQPANDRPDQRFMTFNAALFLVLVTLLQKNKKNNNTTSLFQHKRSQMFAFQQRSLLFTGSWWMAVVTSRNAVAMRWQCSNMRLCKLLCGPGVTEHYSDGSTGVIVDNTDLLSLNIHRRLNPAAPVCVYEMTPHVTQASWRTDPGGSSFLSCISAATLWASVAITTLRLHVNCLCVCVRERESNPCTREVFKGVNQIVIDYIHHCLTLKTLGLLY